MSNKSISSVCCVCYTTKRKKDIRGHNTTITANYTLLYPQIDVTEGVVCINCYKGVQLKDKGSLLPPKQLNYVNKVRNKHLKHSIVQKTSPVVIQTTTDNSKLNHQHHQTHLNGLKLLLILTILTY
jgi:hypothetical protein